MPVANVRFSLLLLGHKETKLEDVKAAYKRAWDKAGNKEQKNAEIEQLDLIEAALGLAQKDKSKKLLETISELKEYLQGLM